MVREHDAAGADTNPRRAARHVRDHHCGRRAGDPDHVVMFREPVAVVAEFLRMPREVERVAEGYGCGAARNDGREVEYGEWRIGHRGRNPAVRGAVPQLPGDVPGTYRRGLPLFKLEVLH